jgi:hypothetical protein
MVGSQQQITHRIPKTAGLGNSEMPLLARGRKMIKHRFNSLFSRGFGHAVPTAIVLGGALGATMSAAAQEATRTQLADASVARSRPVSMPSRKFAENYHFNLCENILQVGVSGGANNV